MAAHLSCNFAFETFFIIIEMFGFASFLYYINMNYYIILYIELCWENSTDVCHSKDMHFFPINIF